MSTWFEDDRRAGWQGSYPPDVPEPHYCHECTWCQWVGGATAKRDVWLCCVDYAEDNDLSLLRVVDESDVACDRWEEM